MENLNLIEILKDAPKGTKLYSPIFGECELEEVHNDTGTIRVKSENFASCFNEDGTYLSGCGECLLFPSKENRDWSTFKVKKGFLVGDHIINKETENAYIVTEKLQASEGVWAKSINCSLESSKVYISEDKLSEYEKVEKFNPKWLKPFDRVLVRDIANNIWRATLLSHITEENKDFPYATSDSCYKYCIPFNEETKHLVGTKDDEPEFYKID